MEPLVTYAIVLNTRVVNITQCRDYSTMVTLANYYCTTFCGATDTDTIEAVAIGENRVYIGCYYIDTQWYEDDGITLLGSDPDYSITHPCSFNQN